MLFFRSSPYQEARVPIIPRLLLPSRPSSMPARRSEGSKCNPSKYNGANPHEQAPTDGLTSTWFSDPWVFKNTSFSPHYYFYLLRLLYIGLYFIRSIRSLVIIKRWWVETGLNQCKLLLGLTVKKWGSWCLGKLLNIQVRVKTERQKHRSRAFQALNSSIRAIWSTIFDFWFSIVHDDFKSKLDILILSMLPDSNRNI